MSQSSSQAAAAAGESPRVGIFGWGVVAPRCPDIDSFAARLGQGDTWMAPFTGFGPSNFLVGAPDFDIEHYRQWVEERFKPARFAQFSKHAGGPVRYAVGAFIQALGQNPGLEQSLQALGGQTHIYVGTGLGDIPTSYEASVAYYKTQRRWNRYWGAASRCPLRAEYEAADAARREALSAEHGIPPPPDPDQDSAASEAACEAWESFWCERSSALRAYLDKAREILAEPLTDDAGKGSLIKRKLVALKRLNEVTGCPPEPWTAINPNLLWNIPNAAAAQISMLGQIEGPAWAPVGACSSFGIAVKLGREAILRGEAKAVIIGMTDADPHPLVVGAFYRANVLSADGAPSKPLSGMRGTHVAGGATVWILGDIDHMRGLGYTPVGLEIVGVGLSSDADHIITPSARGPQISIRSALREAGIDAAQLASWDLHCTATPGDIAEVRNAREVLPELPMAARKGSFGHGMAVAGGWELTAQHLGAAAGRLAPTTLRRDELNPAIAAVHDNFVFDEAVPVEGCYHGKINMGVGGINACVISRAYD